MIFPKERSERAERPISKGITDMPLIPDRFAQFTSYVQGPSLQTDCAITIGVHRQALTGTIDATTQEMFDKVRSAWQTFWSSALGQGYSVTGYKMVGRENGNLYQLEATSSIVGASNNPICPPQVSLLVKKRTEEAGREHRGRMYIPGVLERTGVNGDGRLPAADVAAYQTRFNTLLSSINATFPGTGAQPVAAVILHSSLLQPTRITALTVDPLTATQRRRVR